MQKSRSMMGLPVLQQGEGQNLGKVVDVFYKKEGEILGIIIETDNSSLPELRFIHQDNLAEISGEAVFVSGKEVLQVPQCLREWQGNSYSTALLLGQHIYNELGKEQGVISDVVLDLESGQVEGFQISNGFISDLVSGRDTIPVANVITMGKDMIIIKEDDL